MKFSVGAHFFAILDALGKLKMIAGRGFVTAIYSQYSENDFKFNWTKEAIVDRLKQFWVDFNGREKRKENVGNFAHKKAEQIEMQSIF